MNVQLEIEKLANQLEILKTQVQQQNGIRAGTQAVENHPRTSKSWTPIDSILGSPKMSMTELQSIRGDEDTDEDLERLLETVKEICGDEQDDLRNILETIDDIVISSQDTMRNEPFTLKSLLPSNKIIGHSKKSYNRTHPTKATLNSISSTSFVKPTLANDGNIPKPVYIPAKPQINVPSNRQRNVIKDVPNINLERC